MIYIIKVVKKMDYTSVFIVINYFCLGNTQRIIYLEGELRCTIDSIELNKDSIYTGYCRIFCKYKCHSIDYYPSGAVKSEGYMVCDEEFEIEIWEIGEWKYYDESGNLIKTKDYGDRRTP